MRLPYYIYRRWYYDFNPLIPNGMRHWRENSFTRFFLFQSTHPKRDETSFDFNLKTRVDFNPLIPNGMRPATGHIQAETATGFQSTHPKRDETQLCVWKKKKTPYFNPLIPNGMRLFVLGLSGCAPKISIHSSQTGWDRLKVVKKPIKTYFNPLIPNGMRRTRIRYDFRVLSIFQSTHPKRDETVYSRCKV